MVVESTVRETAIAYAERELYDDAEVTFVGMADTSKGTRVGLEVQLKDGSLFGAFLGALVGALVGVLISLPLVFVLPNSFPSSSSPRPGAGRTSCTVRWRPRSTRLSPSTRTAAW